MVMTDWGLPFLKQGAIAGPAILSIQGGHFLSCTQEEQREFWDTGRNVNEGGVKYENRLNKDMDSEVRRETQLFGVSKPERRQTAEGKKKKKTPNKSKLITAVL